MRPSISYGLIFYQNNEYGHKELVAPWEKISEVAKRLFADEGKLYLITIPARGHWTLVLDLRMGVPFDRQVRHCETLETPSDLSKECGELVLAALLRMW